MIEGIRKEWHAFAADAPGKRFACRYARKRATRTGLAGRIAWVLAGLLFVLLGFVMLFTPGPGLLAMGFGATCLSQESHALCGALDRAELRVRDWYARFRRRR